MSVVIQDPSVFYSFVLSSRKELMTLLGHSGVSCPAVQGEGSGAKIIRTRSWWHLFRLESIPARLGHTGTLGSQ